MANELFTTRSGRQIPVPVVTIPASEVVSLMRLREDFIQRGEHLSMLGVLLDVLDKGNRQVRNQWKNGDLSKNRRDFAKQAAVYMSDPSKYAVELQQLAIKHGLVAGTQVDLSSPVEEAEILEAESVEELTETELEAATSPEKA
jgi:hypothetical protein